MVKIHLVDNQLSIIFLLSTFHRIYGSDDNYQHLSNAWGIRTPRNH